MTNGTQLQPHRGALILVLGILGIVLCQILGIVAWVMGNSDLRAMREGRMDRSGEGLTNAGRVCGMVSVALLALGLLIGLAMIAFGLFATAAATSY
jgi:hypothetical protein